MRQEQWITIVLITIVEIFCASSAKREEKKNGSFNGKDLDSEITKKIFSAETENFNKGLKWIWHYEELKNFSKCFKQ